MGTADMVYLLPSEATRPGARVVMSASVYEAWIARAEQTLDDEAYEDFEEKYVGRAATLDVDDAGRFVLSPAVREAMGLQGEVVFVGRNQHFELRHPEEHDHRAATADTRADAAAGRVPKRGLHPT
ncbi:MAG: division/cell wall cluster transcriptional repressor MraZ [Paracoccaceae bacterium]